MGKNRALRTAARNAADAENYNEAINQLPKPTNNQSNKQIQMAMAAPEADDESDNQSNQSTNQSNKQPKKQSNKQPKDDSAKPITFAQKLAHPEKKVRDGNLVRVRQFIQSANHSIDHTGLAKLLKGMFYCYWLADSQPVQMELADRLSSIQLDCSVDRWQLFVRCYLEMLDREWDGIDRLRMDKFMSWVRIFLNRSFTYLQSHQWSDEVMNSFVEMLSEVPLSTSLNSRRGLFLFYTDIYVVELEKVINAADKPSITFEHIQHLLQPYQAIVAVCRDSSLLNRVEEAIFDRLVEASESSERTVFNQLIRTNSQQFADWFTMLAAAATTPNKYRATLYKYGDQFTAVAQSLPVKKSKKQSTHQALQKALKQATDSNKRKQPSAESEIVSTKRQKLNGQTNHADSETVDEAEDAEMDEDGLMDENESDDEDFEVDESFEDQESDDEDDDEELDEEAVANLIEESIAETINDSVEEESNMVTNDESSAEPVDDDTEVPEIEEEGANLVASADDNLFMSADAFDAMSTPPQAKKTKQAHAKQAKHSPSKLAHAKDAVEMLHEHEKHEHEKHEHEKDHVTPPKHQSPVKKLRPATNQPVNQADNNSPNGIFATPKHKRPESGNPSTNAKSPPPRTPRSVRIDESRNNIKEFDKRKVLDSADKPVLLTKPSPRPAISRKSLEAFNQLAKTGGHLKKPSPKRRMSMSSNVSR